MCAVILCYEKKNLTSKSSSNYITFITYYWNNNFFFAPYWYKKYFIINSYDVKNIITYSIQLFDFFFLNCYYTALFDQIAIYANMIVSWKMIFLDYYVFYLIIITNKLVYWWN